MKMDVTFGWVTEAIDGEVCYHHPTRILRNDISGEVSLIRIITPAPFDILSVFVAYVDCFQDSTPDFGFVGVLVDQVL
jgi:hypothetical protein